MICAGKPCFHIEKLCDGLNKWKIRDIYCYLVDQFMFQFYLKLLPRTCGGAWFDIIYFTHMVLELAIYTNFRCLRKVVDQQVFLTWEWISNCKIDLDTSQTVFQNHAKSSPLNGDKHCNFHVYLCWQILLHSYCCYCCHQEIILFECCICLITGYIIQFLHILHPLKHDIYCVTEIEHMNPNDFYPHRGTSWPWLPINLEYRDQL